jgi:polyferredoxin
MEHSAALSGQSWSVTLTIYYVTPWLRWDRGPYAPNQAVLVDLAHRRFYMFDIEIWPHEFYLRGGSAGDGGYRSVPA